MKKLSFQTLLLGLSAVAFYIPWFGQGCGMFLHQPRVPAKLRESD